MSQTVALSPRHPGLLRAETSVLVVVDMQEKLIGAMTNRDALCAHVTLLIRAARVLGVPILATTQNAPRLGEIAPETREALGDAAAPAINKLCFSCAGSPAFMAAMQETGRRQIVLCGVETHICVCQTAYDLLHAGFAVHVAADAVSSRTVEKHKLGMERIRDGGVLPCAAESAVYEWLGAAGTPAFREVLNWVR